MPWRLGPGMMWERCDALLAAKGSQTISGMKVKVIRHRAGRVECVLARARSGQMLEFSGEHFFSTMPLRSLVRALDPPPPDNVIQAANLLRYRDYLTVVLIVNRSEVFADNWIYVHAPEVRMGRIQNYKNWIERRHQRFFFDREAAVLGVEQQMNATVECLQLQVVHSAATNEPSQRCSIAQAHVDNLPYVRGTEGPAGTR